MTGSSNHLVWVRMKELEEINTVVSKLLRNKRFWEPMQEFKCLVENQFINQPKLVLLTQEWIILGVDGVSFWKTVWDPSLSCRSYLYPLP